MKLATTRITRMTATGTAGAPVMPLASSRPRPFHTPDRGLRRPRPSAS